MNNRQDFQEVIESLHFKPKDLITDNQRSGVYISQGVIAGKDVLVKIYPKNNKEKIHAVGKEVLVDEIISKHNRSNPKAFIDTIRVISSGEDKNVRWIVRQFRNGSPLTPTSNYKKNDILANKYCVIDKKFLNLKSKILSQIFDNLETFRLVDKKNFMSRQILEYFTSRFQTNIENYNIKTLEKKLGFSLDVQVSNYNKIKSKYLDKKNYCASVSDLNLANILIDENCKVIFFDFEQFCLDNYMFDPAFFWLFLWRYPDWQKEILSHFVKSSDDKDFFVSSIIRIIIGWYENIFIEYTDEKENILTIRKLYQSHIWLRFLDAVGNGYDALIKTK
ncbi:MAG: hypothetical protein WC451_00085 [Patescibacteria group bacterium]